MKFPLRLYTYLHLHLKKTAYKCQFVSLKSTMPTAKVTVAVVDDEPQSYEEKHVHAVYDQIAAHFSSTRHKVRLLLKTQPSDL